MADFPAMAGSGPTSPRQLARLRGAREEKMKKIDKEKWGEILSEKTPETHTEVMRKLGITEGEDRKWHEEHGGAPADFSKLEK